MSFYLDDLYLVTKLKCTLAHFDAMTKLLGFDESVRKLMDSLGDQEEYAPLMSNEDQ